MDRQAFLRLTSGDRVEQVINSVTYYGTVRYIWAVDGFIVADWYQTAERCGGTVWRSPVYFEKVRIS